MTDRHFLVIFRPVLAGSEAKVADQFACIGGIEHARCLASGNISLYRAMYGAGTIEVVETKLTKRIGV